MPDLTTNHGLQLWAAGELDWEHRDDMQAIERTMTIRDFDSNLSNYTPYSGARFEATDTGAVYLGDGSAWNKADIDAGAVSADSLDVASTSTFNDSVEITSGILDVSGANGDVHAEGVRIFGGSFGYNQEGGESTSIYDIANDVHVLTATAGGDLQVTTDLFEVPNASTTTRIPGIYITQGGALAYNEGGGQSFDIYNATSGNPPIKAQSDDTVTFPAGDVELTNTNAELRTNAIIVQNGKAIGYNRGGAESTGFYNETSGSFSFHADENNDVSAPNGSVSSSGGYISDQRGAPTTSELADGQRMQYVSDGSDGNAAGDLVSARNNAGTIVTQVIAAAADDTA